MAGDWIKMRNDLADDPAVIGIAALTDLDEFAVVGRLQHLWAWADRQSRDGHAEGVTFVWIDRKVRCDGFAAAMEKLAWLVKTETGIFFPNFDRHNGEPAKKRALGANRKQKQRSCPEDVPHVVTQGVPQESRGLRDKSVTREEKRREDIEDPPKPPKGGGVVRLRSSDQLPPGLLRFWEVWPPSKRKEGRGKCAEVWIRNGYESLSGEIISHVLAKKVQTDWCKDGGAYVEAPLVYLNQRKWDGAQLPGSGSDRPEVAL